MLRKNSDQLPRKVPKTREEYEAQAALLGMKYSPSSHTFYIQPLAITTANDREPELDADTMEELNWRQVLCRVSDGSEYWFNNSQYEWYSAPAYGG